MLDIYTTTANAKSKENNLSNRAEYFEKHYLPFLKRHRIFKDGSICIELGCGQGHKLDKLIKAFPSSDFSGLEKSRVMIDKAKTKLPNIKLVEGDITDMREIPSNSVDVACLFQVLHHLSVEERQIALGEILRILKTAGYIIVIDSFRPESGAIKQSLWDTVNRFYAVLSQHPVESITLRTNEAIKSVFNPKKYNPEEYAYFSPTHSNLFGEKMPKVKLLMKETPRIFTGIVPCVSDILVFGKN